MSVRILLGAVIFLIGLLVLALFLLATDTALSVWERLAAAPAWLRVAWAGGLLVTTVLSMWLTWRWLRPARKDPTSERSPVLDPEALDQAILDSERDGVDISEALAELEEHRRRQSGGEIYLAIFGEVSTGKSTLVSALLPGADAQSDAQLQAQSDVRAGSTKNIKHYRWSSEGGDSIVLVDLPGFNLGEDQQVSSEVRRAHLLIFLTSGDLTDSQFEELQRFQELDKPLILALNKSDQYRQEELKTIRQRLSEITGIDEGDIVPVRSGGREEIVRLLADGQERLESRERGADVEPLRRAIQARLDQNAQLLTSLRDDSVLLLASEALDSARQSHRAEQAEVLVTRYSRRAVVGALAAVAPGSDLVIQGALATRLIQQLCELYEVSVKEVQIEEFLKLAGGRVRKMSALTMAITGNALKAFPGLGTLSGGLLHAVAYGMIFDSLGKAAAQTLASRGDLRPLPAARAFEEQMHESLEKGAGRFAKLAAREIARRETT